MECVERSAEEKRVPHRPRAVAGYSSEVLVDHTLLVKHKNNDNNNINNSEEGVRYAY